MLKSLFKPKWQSQQQTTRLKAVDKLARDYDKNRLILAQIVKTDSEECVRNAALAQITERDLLSKILHECSFENTQQAIQKKLVDSYHIKELGELSQTELLDIALFHSFAKTRLKAAELIDKIGLMELLIKDSNDKSVARHAREQVRKHKKQQLAAEREQEKISQLCSSAQNLAAEETSMVQYGARCDALWQKWREIEATASEEEQQLFSQAMAKCEQRLAAIDQQQQDQQQATATAKKQQQVIDNLQQLLKTLGKEQLPAADLAAQTNAQESKWQQHNSQHKASAELAQEYANLLQQAHKQLEFLTNLEHLEADIFTTIGAIDESTDASYQQFAELGNKITTMQSKLDWEQKFAQPAIVNSWQKAVVEFEKIRQQRQKRSEKTVRELIRKRRQLDAHIEKGELKTANSLHHNIARLMDNLNPKELVRQQERLQPIEQKLQKLRDWHGFSTEPKKEKLCAQMEALTTEQNSHMSPEERAQAINDLQQKWREQTAVNIIQDDPLWLRFKQAGDEAYRPLATYYQQQDELKKQHLAQRYELYEQLAAHYEQLDFATITDDGYKKLQQIIQQARRDFNSLKPISYKHAKAVNNDFFAMLDKYNQHLKQHWQHNLQLKQELIEKAQQLENEDNASAIEKAIIYQQKWQEIGHTFHSRQQQLWRDFRAACDTVFKQRDALRDKEQQKTAEKISAGEELVAKAHDFGKDPRHTKSELQQLEQLEQELQQITDLPQAVANKLELVLQLKARQLKDSQRQQLQQQQLQQMAELAELAAKCNSLEQELFDHQQIDTDELQKLEQKLATLSLENQQIISPRVAALQTSNANSSDLETIAKQNRQQLEQLAIALEVLSDSPTEQKYSQQRLQYQLQLLNKHMGAPLSDVQQQQKISKILTKWYATGVCENRQQFEPRLATVLDKLHGTNATD